jgi:hypothetical protein
MKMSMAHDRAHLSANPDQDPETELGLLLDEQIAAVRGGDFGRVDRLSVQTGHLVAQVVRNAGRDPSPGSAGRDRLRQLYNELILALQAECDDVQAKLKQLRRVKQAVGAYGMGTRR